MRLTRRSLTGLAAATLLLAACTGAVPAEPDRTNYLVRHAEKPAGDDPSLTPEGTARAWLLAKTLADARIARICSNDYARTRETAELLADFMSLPVDSMMRQTCPLSHLS